ncbi:MAG: hypothetical protein J0I09_09360 [Sphingobacteriia bacterium]|nr:hypothetical protein [Sphingobacteriia bacterium]
MKKILAIVFSVAIVAVTAAQAPQNNPAVLGNLQGLKIAYITKHLNLSSDEAQKFWPIYYNYSDELRDVRNKNKDNAIALDESTLEVKKRYYVELKKVLGADERVNKVFLIERDFAAEVKKELEKRQQLKKQQPK